MKQLGEAVPIDITGYLFPWLPERERPLFIWFEGLVWLPLFSTLEKLHAGLREACAGVDLFTVKQVEEQGGFLASIAKSGEAVAICVDLRREANGKLRFAKLVF